MEGYKLKNWIKDNVVVVLLIYLGVGFVLGAMYGIHTASIDKVQFSTVDAQSCLAEANGKKFLVIDVTDELKDVLAPEDAEGQLPLDVGRIVGNDG